MIINIGYVIFFLNCQISRALMNPAIQLIKQLKKRHKLDDAYEVLVEEIDRLYKVNDFAAIDEMLFVSPSEFGMDLSVAILSFTWAFQDRLRYYNYFLNRVRERALLRDDPKLEDLLLNFERPPNSSTTGSSHMQYQRLREVIDRGQPEPFDPTAPLLSRSFGLGYRAFVEALANGASVKEARQTASDAVEIYEAVLDETLASGASVKDVKEARQTASDAVEIYEAALDVFSRLGLPPQWVKQASRFVALRGQDWLDVQVHEAFSEQASEMISEGDEVEYLEMAPEEAGEYSSDELYELVRDGLGVQASNLNNRGPEEQLQYLYGGLGLLRDADLVDSLRSLFSE